MFLFYHLKSFFGIFKMNKIIHFIDEDYDEGVEEQLVDEDDEDVYTLSKLGDLLHALFSTYKEAFLPVFDQILPYVVKLLVRYPYLYRLLDMIPIWPY
jgi:hypothetical protein